MLYTGPLKLIAFICYSTVVWFKEINDKLEHMLILNAFIQINDSGNLLLHLFRKIMTRIKKCVGIFFLLQTVIAFWTQNIKEYWP